MRILYYSVHAILEYDELRLFHELGYTVFPLGSYFGGKRSEKFRPELQFGSDYASLLARFFELGGVYSRFNNHEENYIPKKFVDLFDASIVMHEPGVIIHHWETLSRRPVIWRTIGVDIEGADVTLEPYRNRGLKIVRYSPSERFSPSYLGHEAIIRFCKRPADFLERRQSGKFILTFSNDFASRYPNEFAAFIASTAGQRALLGGRGNESFPGNIGLVSYERQLSLLSMAACYYYCAGTFIPYTLNFMEAWLSGVPLIALNCDAFYAAERCRFAEIPQLIKSGVDGLIVESAQDARAAFAMILEDDDIGRRIGAAGATAAAALFGEEAVGPLWRNLLLEVTR